MLKIVVIVFMLFACCYCLEKLDNNELLVEDSRAKKKKGSGRLLAMILLLVISKVAALKVATFFMFMAFFQKVFYLVGLFLNYFLKNKLPSAPKPQAVYGAPGPQDYNTVGYSYGPPEHGLHHAEAFSSQEQGVHAVSELGGSLNWLFNKNHH